MNDYLLLREFRDIKNTKFVQNNTWIKANMLELSAIQYFAKRSTTQNRLLLKLGTGVGKTLTSLEAALPFVRMFNILNNKISKTYYVYIIGYSKNVFKKEFLKFPELNIITYEEIHELAKLREVIKTIPEYMKDEYIAKLRALKIKINRRISNVDIGGMYNFYGYRELFNDLFTNDSRSFNEINSYNLMQKYAEKKVSINKILLDRFKYSLMIVDEIHLAYNSEFMNNYGLALQFILDYYKNDISLILLTATIINNNKREFIDICNLLRDTNHEPFKEEDFPELTNKDNKKIYTPDEWHKFLKPLYQQLDGKVIFLEETGEEYPTLNFMGKKHKNIAYIKFNDAKMSKLHEQTFAANNLYDNTSKQFIINDMVFPNPIYKAEKYEAEVTSDMVGLFDNTKLLEQINNAPQSWQHKVGISVRNFKNFSICTGTFLRRENLIMYSTKYCELIDIIYECLTNNPLAKIMIYHPYIVGSGVSLLGEIMRFNGFIPIDGVANKNTYSAEKFVTLEKWSNENKGRNFFPAKYVTIDADTNDNQKEAILDEWNSLENKYGKYIKILIGAGKIKQSVDMKDTTILIIAQRPKTMSDFIQIIGRVVRKGSLANIGSSNVYLYTLLSTTNNAAKESIEERKYRKKIKDFDDIRNIEYNINKNAINNYIYADENGNMEFKPVNILGSIPFTLQITLPAKKIRSLTYFGHGHYSDTMNEITKWIKRAFISIQVWEYEPLYNFILNANLALDDAITKQLFNICLKKLIYKSNVYSETSVSNIFNADNIYFSEQYINGSATKINKKVITECGKFYILTIINNKGIPVLKFDSFLTDINFGVYKEYNFSVKNFDIMTKINYEQLSKIITNMTKIELRKYSLRFLLEWSEDSHYIFMQNTIIGKNTIPKQLSNMYRKLLILGDNWYEDKINRHIYIDKEWKLEQKKVTQKEEHDFVGIIQNMKLKIRRKMSENTVVTDNRNVERGITCASIEKERIVSMLKSFDIVSNKPRTKSLCKSLYHALLEHEIKARQENSSKKYLYLFNE